MQFPFIVSGYRKDIKNYREAFGTLFKIHNETANIWTMIMSFMLASSLFVYIVSFQKEHVNIVPFVLFYCANVIHLPFSLGYHLFLPISNEIKVYWRNLDITFIFISGTLFACALGYCVLKRILLLILFSTCFNVSCFAIYTIRKKKNYDRVLVCKLVGIIVICYMFPMFYHAFTRYDFYSFNLGFTTCIVMGISAIVYADCIPEKYAYPPGKYDIIGNSHNIMHLGLMIAYVIEYMFIYHTCKT